MNVNTVTKASTPTLVVTGSVFFLESEIPVGSNLAVTVMNPDSMVEATGMTDADGMYSITFFSPTAHRSRNRGYNQCNRYAGRDNRRFGHRYLDR